jgi:transposase-like protein
MFYCPVCKSPDIFPVAGGYMGQIYACKKCKYRGSFVLEIDPLPGGEAPEDRR